ncbi:hypothetical protein [Methylobacillus flagellatus]|uniref:hypothetical protein n=1 Tax=Methylobacillus flagellatus TaxID=405 RepID=UPI0010F545B6|nr:hypothetical protein [Methylobacillus flagellatus]
MKKFFLFISLAILANTAAQAKPDFTGRNYSGTYACKGYNEKVGDYEVTVGLRLNRVSSYGDFGAYHYTVETPNSVVYHGQAAADGPRLAISFQLGDGKNVEQSTGLALMKRDSRGRLSFRKKYYEPDDNGGNYGFEDCNILPPAKTVKP